MSAIFTDPKTISTTPGFSISPSNCVIWLDGSDKSTFYQLSTNTGLGYSDPVVNESDPVGFWLDRSDYGNHFGVTLSANRPVYSLSSVYFDGVTAKWLEDINENGIYSYRSNTVDVLSGLTYFIVSEAATNTGARTIFTQLTTTGTVAAYNATNIVVPNVIQSGTSFVVHTYGTARLTHGTMPDYITSLEPRSNIITTVYAYNNVMQLMVGGNPLYTVSSHLNGATTVRRIRIGSDLNNFTTPANSYIGRIKEIIVYNIPLTFQQQKMVEAYLGEKWKAPYNTYPDSGGNFEDPGVWFNNVVPQLSTATVLPNGFTIALNTSGVYPRFQNKNFTNWGWADPGISKGGTFTVNGNIDVITENVFQDVPWGGLGRARENGQPGGDAVSPVITVPAGSTLNLKTQRIQSLSYTVPTMRVDGGTANIQVPILYGHSSSSALIGLNSATISISGATLATANRWNTTASPVGTVISVYSNTTCSLLSCTLEDTAINLVTDTNLVDRSQFMTHVYNNNATTVFNNCTIGSYGARQTNSGSGNTTEANGVGVNLNATGSFTNAYFNNCTLLCKSNNTYTIDKVAVYINNSQARGYFDNCVIRGSNFDNGTVSRINGNKGIIINNGGLAQITNSLIVGGDGSGTYNSGTLRFDQIGTYPAAIGLYGSTSLLTLSACNVYGNSVKKAQGVFASGGVMNTSLCNFYAGPDSNAVNGSFTTCNISGPVIEDSGTGYRAIACPRFFINPIPKNAYIRYATDGTGTGFNAFTYQYTIDSLSAFSMPDVSAVRLGTPYAGGLLVGTAVIPPAEAVSYGTLVDNTTGSAILTLDLLNTFFQTPLSALTTPGTIGYRVANSLTTNESVGTLIASFTTS